MRTILPSALLVAGTVALLGTGAAFAEPTTAPNSADATPPTAAVSAQAGADSDQKSATADAHASPTQDDGQPGGLHSLKVQDNPLTQSKDARSGPSGASRRGGGFMIFSEKELPLEPEDSQDKIDKARPLHEQAMEQYKNHDLAKALATEQQAVEAAPNYWLPHAGMAFLQIQAKHSPFLAVKDGSLSTRTRHPAVADSNQAKMLELMHWYQPAVTLFQRALKADPDNWQNRLSLFDCYINLGDPTKAKKALDEIPQSEFKDFDCVNMAAARYLQLPDYPRVKELYQQAIDVAQNPTEKQEAIDMLYAASVKSGDSEEATKLRSQISQSFKNDQPMMYFTGEARWLQSPADADALLSVAASVESDKSDQIFYAIGKELLHKADADSNPESKKQWLTKADTALQNAVSRQNTEIRYHLALAKVADELNDQNGIVKALNSLRDSLPVGATPNDKSEIYDPVQAAANAQNRPKFNLLEAVTVTKSDKGASYKSSLREMQIKLLKPSCTCHARAITTALSQQPGVLFTDISHASQPVVSVIYDSKKNSMAKLLTAQVFSVVNEPFDKLGDKPISTIAALDDFVVAHDDNSAPKISLPKPVLDMPMETAQVAQTGSDH